MNAADHPREQERMRTESGESTETVENASSGGIAPAKGIRDFMDLYPRHVRFNVYSVLSLAGDEPTAYTVDTDKLSCSCPDFHYSREDPSVCKHLAAALFEAPKRRSLEDFAAEDLAQLVRDVVDASSGGQSASAPTPQPDTPERTDADSADTAASQEPPADTDDRALSERVDDWMDSYVRHSQHVTATDRDHGGTFGVALEIDYDSITETQKDQIKTDLKQPDGVKHHTGFLDDGCKVCGEADDDYWIHYPEPVVRGLPG